MTAGPLLLVLIAALAHALWNLASKYADGDTSLFVWSYTVLSAVLCSAVAIASPDGSLSWSLILAAFVSAVFHVAYSLVLQRGYQDSDVSLVYPVARGVGPLLTLIVAITVLGERPGLVATTGALVVIGGVAVVIGTPTTSASASLRPLAWGAGTGAAIAAYTLWDSYSIARLDLEPISYFAATLVLEALLLTPTAWTRRSAIRVTVATNRRVIAVVAVLSPFAYILVLTALQSLPVAIVAPLRESSIVVAALLTWWLLDEQHIVRRLSGAAVVVIGIAMISLG